MNTDAHIIELVEAYLDGRLSDTERAEFEERYAREPEFAATADGWAHQVKLVRAYGEANLKQSLKDRFDSKPATHKHSFRRTLIAAAAAIVLLAAVLLGRSLMVEPSMSELYADNFSAPSFATRGGNEMDNDRQWREASAFYHQREYVKAAAMLETLLNQTAFTHISEGYLCLGICYLKMDEPQKALRAFSQVKPGSVFVQNSQWYQLLSYLQMEDREGAIKAANTILAVDRHYKTEATLSILEVLQ